METAERWVYFSMPQFLLLLYQREVENLLLFNEIKNAVPNDKELITAMEELIREGILLPGEGDRFRICDEIREIMDVLSETSRVFLINGDRGRIPPEFVFAHNGKAVSLRMDAHHDAFIRLGLSSAEEAVRRLTDYEFIPDIFSQGEAAPDVDISADTEELLASRSVLLIVEQYPRDGTELQRRICILRTAEQESMMAEYKNGKTQTCSYSVQTFVDLLLGD